jgi:hypothetical protein
MWKLTLGYGLFVKPYVHLMKYFLIMWCNNIAPNIKCFPTRYI